jgi:hypothetical protein
MASLATIEYAASKKPRIIQNSGPNMSPKICPRRLAP